ncbi:transporter [Oxalobacteraceae bacterium CAVE-383]|nr:transporter [Oxalobacteraceae bacterium CAVE-383]
MILQLIKKITFAAPVFVLGLLGSAQNAMAAHPLATDDPGTQGAGNNQLEINSDRVTARDGSGQTVGDVTYSRGVTDTLDLFADQPMTVSAPRGMGDTSLGLKWRFFENGTTSIAFKPSVSLANANDEKGFGSGRNNVSALLIVGQNFGNWNFYYNAGLQTNRFKSDDTQSVNRRSLWQLSAAATYAVTPQLRAVGDIGVKRNADIAGEKNPAYALTGVIYSPSEHVDLDVGLRFGLNNASIRHQAGAGVTLHF